jgi:hypothetical protein
LPRVAFQEFELSTGVPVRACAAGDVPAVSFLTIELALPRDGPPSYVGWNCPGNPVNEFKGFRIGLDGPAAAVVPHMGAVMVCVDIAINATFLDQLLGNVAANEVPDWNAVPWDEVWNEILWNEIPD